MRVRELTQSHDRTAGRADEARERGRRPRAAAEARVHRARTATASAPTSTRIEAARDADGYHADEHAWSWARRDAQRARYRLLIGRVRDLVRSGAPPRAKVPVVSQGDERCSRFDKRTGWHFLPQREGALRRPSIRQTAPPRSRGSSGAQAGGAASWCSRRPRRGGSITTASSANISTGWTRCRARRTPAVIYALDRSETGR